jgi:hypothetical protein
MRLILMLGTLVLGIGAAYAEDVAGSADHPLIPRYEGSEILKYDTPRRLSTSAFPPPRSSGMPRKTSSPSKGG